MSQSILRHVGRSSARQLGVFCSLGLLLSALACSAADDVPRDNDDDDGFSSGGDDDGDLSGEPGSGGSSSGGGGPLPEEEEDDSSFRAPVVSGRFLWSANPESGRVALIDADSAAVQILSAGLFPTYLAAVPTADDSASALVLNVGSFDASWFRTTKSGVKETKLPLHRGGNRWSVSSSGKWAVAFGVAESGQRLDPTEGLQEITILHLDEVAPTTTRLTVGYRPSQVVVTEGDRAVVVVSEEGITGIQLDAAPQVSSWIELGPASGRDVSISSDGKYALVRRAGSMKIDVYDLAAPEDPPVALTLNGVVTDLDLSPSGRAVAVLRDQRKLVTFKFPEVLTDLDQLASVTIPSEFFGSAALTEDGERAVLYTNAVDQDRVTLVDLRPGPGFLSGHSVSTQSPVANVITGVDGKHAVVLAKPKPGEGSSFTVLSLTEKRFPRVVGTDAPVIQVAVSAEAAIVTSSDGVVHEAHLVQLPNFSLESVPLASPPLATGVIADFSLGYVAQSHSAGRVTFLDLQSRAVRTLTGFELAAEVVDR